MLKSASSQVSQAPARNVRLLHGCFCVIGQINSYSFRWPCRCTVRLCAVTTDCCGVSPKLSSTPASAILAQLMRPFRLVSNAARTFERMLDTHSAPGVGDAREPYRRCSSESESRLTIELTAFHTTKEVFESCHEASRGTLAYVSVPALTSGV